MIVAAEAEMYKKRIPDVRYWIRLRRQKSGDLIRYGLYPTCESSIK